MNWKIVLLTITTLVVVASSLIHEQSLENLAVSDCSHWNVHGTALPDVNVAVCDKWSTK